MSAENFIKYLINEDIYVIGDEASTLQTEETEEIISQEVVVVDNKYKSIVVIVEDDSSENLNEKDHQYLSKVLSAVKVDMESISLINTQKETFENLIGVEKIIDFTPNHSIAPDAIPYELSNFDSAQMIVANPLAEIAESVDLRKKLWEALKSMFN